MSDGKILAPRNYGILIAVASAAIFGVWPSCVRAVYQDGGNIPFALLCTTTARMLAMTLFCIFTGKKLFAARKDANLALRGGAFQALAVGTAIAAMAYIPGPVAITVMFSHTIMLLFFLGWRGEAKLDRMTVLSTLSALVGLTFVVNLWSVEGRVDGIGVALALVSAVATMSRLYVFGEMTKTRHPAVVGAETFIFTLMFVLAAMLLWPPVMPGTAAGWGWIALGSAAMAAGTFGMFYGIALIGSFRFSLFFKCEPVFTALFSVLLIGEHLAFAQYAGILMVIASLAAYQWLDHRAKSRQTTA